MMPVPLMTGWMRARRRSPSAERTPARTLLKSGTSFAVRSAVSSRRTRAVTTDRGAPVSPSDCRTFSTAGMFRSDFAVLAGFRFGIERCSITRFRQGMQCATISLDYCGSDGDDSMDRFVGREHLQDFDVSWGYEPPGSVLDCGGKRSATPLLDARHADGFQSGVAAALCHRSPHLP